MKNIIKISFFVVLALVSCAKDDDTTLTPTIPLTAEKEINLKEYFVAGTLGFDYGGTSVYAISFLEKGKAILYTQTANFVGSYKLEDKILTIEVNETANYHIFKFHLNDLNQVKFSYFQKSQSPQLATGKLLKISEENVFKGSAFFGKELKKGGVVSQENWYYKFSEDGKKFGTGETLANITPEHSVEFLNPNVFRYSVSGHYEIGFVDGDVLTTSSERKRVDYSGTFNLVK